MKVAGYTRVSTDEQGKNGVSLDMQAHKIRQYTSLQDMDLVEIIEDSGKSAKNLNREGIQRIMNLLKTRQIQAVIIYKLDRLTRSVKDLNSLIELFNKHDVSLCSVKDNLDTKSAAGRMVINILGTISQWERETIGERTSEALEELRRQKKRYGTVPFGKKVENGELVDNPDEKKILRSVSGFKKAGYSLTEIAEALNAAGYRARTGAGFNKQSVRNLVRLAA